MRLARLPLSAAWLVVFALAGCGGEDEDGATVTIAKQPEPAAPLSEQLTTFERAVAKPHCGLAVQVIHPVLFTDPEHPDSFRNCEDAQFPVRAEAGVTVTDSAEYGTGALVDTELDGNKESLIWALDASGRFKWTGAFVRATQVGTDPDSESDFEDQAVAFVDALRDGDCTAAHATIDKGSRLDYGDEATFCKKFADTFESPGGLAERLRDDPDAVPVPLGATREVAFYGLSTEPTGYRTLIVGVSDPNHEPRVLDVVPVER